MKPIVLCILDGCGLRDESDGNAFKNAKKPNFDYLWNNYPHSKLQASGKFVGLPDGQMGNSEVGHTNIGAGRVVYQPLELINESIRNSEFFKNENLLETIRRSKDNNSKIHLIGLISDGGVHSHIDHLLALLKVCKMNDISNVYLHLITDGRDVPPKSAYKYIKIVEDAIEQLQVGTIATIGGRYYAMDRDNNYDRLKKYYDALVYSIGGVFDTPKSGIEYNYSNGITDEFLEPFILDANGKIEDNDSVITFNFRKDRLRELFTALTNPDFDDMEVRKYNNLNVITMMPVVKTVIAKSIFDDNKFSNLFGEYLSKLGYSQLRIAETEKFAHVTFFFDGGKEINFSNEEKKLIPSPKVSTYDKKPEMSAIEITNVLLNELDNYDVVILNYANGDMVGHTGNYDAAVNAVEVIDDCLGKIYSKVKQLNGCLIVTADHGNCDIMWDENHNIVTSHTTMPVPLIITKDNIKLKDGKLADIAPTILSIMGEKIPEEMTGDILILE